MGINKGRLLTMALIVLCALVLTSCSPKNEAEVTEVTSSTAAISESSPEETESISITETEESDDGPANTIGGTPGNIANNSFWGFQGNKLYYRANYDLGILNLETGELKKIVNAGGNYIQVLGNEVYNSGLMGLGQIDLQTGEIKTIASDSASYINAVDGWLYYINTTDGNKVYRVKMNGENREKLSDLADVEHLVYYDGQLFFNRYWNAWDFYKMNTDGTNLVMLQEQWIEFFLIHDGWIYVVDLNTEPNGIYRYDVNGGNRTLLTEAYGDFMNICGDYLFFQNIDDGYKLYKVPLSGGAIEKVLDMNIGYIHSYGDYLYFFNPEDPDYRVHRMHYDSNIPEPLNMPAAIE